MTEPTNLDELSALYDAGTPGEWAAGEDPCDGRDYNTMILLPAMGHTWIARTEHNWNEADRSERRISWKEAENNAAWIAKSRNAFPAMKAELVALRAENERQAELAKTYRIAQLTAEQKLCREQANADGWIRRCQVLEQTNERLRGLFEEDALEEAISDSLEMDWHPRDAAREIIRRAALGSKP